MVILYNYQALISLREKIGAELKWSSNVPETVLFLLQSTYRTRITRKQAQEELPTPSELRDRSIFSLIPWHPHVNVFKSPLDTSFHLLCTPLELLNYCTTSEHFYCSISTLSTRCFRWNIFIHRENDTSSRFRTLSTSPLWFLDFHTLISSRVKLLYHFCALPIIRDIIP